MFLQLWCTHKSIVLHPTYQGALKSSHGIAVLKKSRASQQLGRNTTINLCMVDRIATSFQPEVRLLTLFPNLSTWLWKRKRGTRFVGETPLSNTRNTHHAYTRTHRKLSTLSSSGTELSTTCMLFMHGTRIPLQKLPMANAPTTTCTTQSQQKGSARNLPRLALNPRTGRHHVMEVPG